LTANASFTTILTTDFIVPVVCITIETITGTATFILLYRSPLDVFSVNLVTIHLFDWATILYASGALEGVFRKYALKTVSPGSMPRVDNYDIDDFETTTKTHANVMPVELDGNSRPVLMNAIRFGRIARTAGFVIASLHVLFYAKGSPMSQSLIVLVPKMEVYAFAPITTSFLKWDETFGR
jgi:hypothetical protein